MDLIESAIREAKEKIERLDSDINYLKKNKIRLENDKKNLQSHVQTEKNKHFSRFQERDELQSRIDEMNKVVEGHKKTLEEWENEKREQHKLRDKTCFEFYIKCEEINCRIEENKKALKEQECSQKAEINSIESSPEYLNLQKILASAREKLEKIRRDKEDYMKKIQDIKLLSQRRREEFSNYA